MPDVQDAFLSVYRANARGIFNFAAKMVGWEEAYDLTQEVFLRFYRSGVFDGRAKSWLYRTAYRLCIDYRRKKKNILVDNCNDFAGWGEHYADPEGAYLEKEYRAQFVLAFKSLPAEYRAILLMRAACCSSYKDIAAMTGLSLESVRSRLYRARLALHRSLRKIEAGEDIE